MDRGSALHCKPLALSQTLPRCPEIDDACGFVPWLEFMEKTQLISWNCCPLVLTRGGKPFSGSDLLGTR